jgi:hypothetical protein
MRTTDSVQFIENIRVNSEGVGALPISRDFQDPDHGVVVRDNPQN